MLTTVLKTEVAEEISIKIMDAFVAMKHYLINNGDIYKSISNINNKLIEHDDNLKYYLINLIIKVKLLKLIKLLMLIQVFLTY